GVAGRRALTADRCPMWRDDVEALDVPVRYGRRRLQVVRAAGHDPGAAVPGQYAQLGEYVLALVPYRYLGPEVVPAARHQLGPVEQHARADPGDPVRPPLARCQAQPLLDVQQVGGGVHARPVPPRPARLDPLRPGPGGPLLVRRLLTGAEVVHIGQSVREVA